MDNGFLGAQAYFQQTIEKVKLTKSRQVVLDLSNVPFINSAGLGLLMLAHKGLQETDIRFSLEVPEGCVLDVLTLSNIGNTIPISVADPKPALSLVQ